MEKVQDGEFKFRRELVEGVNNYMTEFSEMNTDQPDYGCHHEEIKNRICVDCYKHFPKLGKKRKKIK